MRIFPNCGGLKTSNDHLTSLITNLNLQRKNGDSNYCDVTLICNTSKFLAHRAILAGSSSYFDCLIGGPFAESKQNEIDLTESISSPEILEGILDFIYTGKLYIEGCNFRELLDACCLLLLNDASKLLSQYLKNSLVISNCLEIFQLAYKYSLDSILHLCVIIIQSRMHDYFRHQPDMLSLPPDAFVYLCEQDVFLHTNQQDITTLIEGYIKGLLNAPKVDISKKLEIKLHQIINSCGITEIPIELQGIIQECLPASNSETPTNIKVKTNVVSLEESEEILLMMIVEKEKLKYNPKHLHTYGWLKKTSKWIKLPSVDVRQINCAYINDFIGFADNAMVYKLERGRSLAADKDVIVCPLDGDEQKLIEGVCEYCKMTRPVHSSDKRYCPHLYFGAWNELFCLYPVTLTENDSDQHKKNYFKKPLWLHYDIMKYSAQHDTWNHVTTLEIPPVYYWKSQKRMKKVAFLRFKSITSTSYVHFIIANREEEARTGLHGNYLTVMQLSQNSEGSLQSEVLFHKEVTIAQSTIGTCNLYFKCVLTATSERLKFFDEKGNSFDCKKTIKLVAEFDLQRGTFLQQDSETRDLWKGLPKTYCDRYRCKIYKPSFNYLSSDGCLYHDARLLPYVNVIWSYDPVKNEWKTLPGPPTDQVAVHLLGSGNIHIVPPGILSQLAGRPACMFEDTSESRNHGPYVPVHDRYDLTGYYIK